jgi:hypothetical protein
MSQPRSTSIKRAAYCIWSWFVMLYVICMLQFSIALQMVLLRFWAYIYLWLRSLRGLSVWYESNDMYRVSWHCTPKTGQSFGAIFQIVNKRMLISYYSHWDAGPSLQTSNLRRQSAMAFVWLSGDREKHPLAEQSRCLHWCALHYCKKKTISRSLTLLVIAANEMSE